MSFTVLPTPQSMEFEAGSVTVGRGSRVELDGNVPAGLVERVTAILSDGPGQTPIRLTMSPEANPEACEVIVRPDQIRISAGKHRGFVYGIDRLEQLMKVGRVPLGRVRDFPSLPVRGFQLNFHALRHMKPQDALRVLDSMARWKLNTVLLEYGDRYPYRKHKAICADDALNLTELDMVLSHARSLGLELVPLHQCLGHVNFILRHDEYAHLREEDDKRDQWCPLNPASFDLFRELIDDVVETHHGIRYLHIGGDEARRLGQCPRCAEAAHGHGPSRLYVEFVVKAIEHIKSHGLTPIIWDDVLCRHPEVIDELPRDAVIMYWEYWTTQNPSAVFVARPDGKGVVVDKRWTTEWAGELDPVEHRMIDCFARPIDFEKDLSPAFLDRFGQYLGDEFPKRVRGFPYLEYYQDMGFQVLCAPAGGSNQSTWRRLPDWPRYADNINAFCRRAYEARALGVVTTSWYDFPIDAVAPAIMYTGQAGWNVSTGERQGGV